MSLLRVVPTRVCPPENSWPMNSIGTTGRLGQQKPGPLTRARLRAYHDRGVRRVGEGSDPRPVVGVPGPLQGRDSPGGSPPATPAPGPNGGVESVLEPGRGSRPRPARRPTCEIAPRTRVPADRRPRPCRTRPPPSAVGLTAHAGSPRQNSAICGAQDLAGPPPSRSSPGGTSTRRCRRSPSPHRTAARRRAPRSARRRRLSMRKLADASGPRARS